MPICSDDGLVETEDPTFTFVKPKDGDAAALLFAVRNGPLLDDVNASVLNLVDARSERTPTTAEL